MAKGASDCCAVVLRSRVNCPGGKYFLLICVWIYPIQIGLVRNKYVIFSEVSFGIRGSFPNEKLLRGAYPLWAHVKGKRILYKSGDALSVCDMASLNNLLDQRLEKGVCLGDSINNSERPQLLLTYNHVEIQRNAFSELERVTRI